MTPLTISLEERSVIRHRCRYYGRDIARALDSFRNGDLQEYASIDALVRSMASAGKVFLGNTLKDPGRSYYQLQRFFKSACPAYPDGGIAPLIHVVADPDEYFPWELLPLFVTQKPITVNDQMSLEAACRQFLGFNAIVERRALRWVEGRSFLNAYGSLPLRFVYDARYEGAIAEASFLLSRRHVHVEGPYPRSVSDSAAPTLAHQLANPQLA